VVGGGLGMWGVGGCFFVLFLGGEAECCVRVTSFFKPKETAVAPSEGQAEINIFTVASGLLYEVCKNWSILIRKLKPSTTSDLCLS